MNNSKSSAVLKMKNKLYKNIHGMKKNWELYLLILPAVVLIFCFSYIPLYGIQIAFKDFKPQLGMWGSSWTGFTHFKTFFESSQFLDLLFNTISLNLYGLIAGFPFPIILALMINQIRAKKFKQTVQVVAYLPHFISTVVMVGILLMLLSPSSGLVGSISKLIGIQNPINIMGEAGAFQSLYVWSGIWQHAGWDSIIYIAALSSIDTALYEAATIDGASKWQRIKYIDIPFLIPTAVILLILSMGGMMNVGFEKVYLMQNSLNTSVSEVISTYVYKIGIVGTHYSYSAAIGLFNNIVNFIILLVFNKLSKLIGDTSLF